MKFLLVAVNAKFIHTNPAVYSLRAYAGGRLRRQVEISEYTINQRMEEILSDIYRREPDAVAFSCYIWNWRMIRELTAELRKLRPDLPLWLGGPEVSFEAEEVLRHNPGVTGIMVGEGEGTFRELLEYYAEGEGRLAGIRGLVMRDGEGRINRTAERELLPVDSLPFLYEGMELPANRILYYESGRGCPYRCSYCLSSVDKTLRLRSVEKVKRELSFFLERKVPQVKFVDRTFNADRGHAMEIWEYIAEHDNGVTNFHFELAAQLLDEEELSLLGRMRPGQVQLEIGVQSANSRTLEAICRTGTLERLEAAVRRIKETGNIHLHLDLIAGLPYEDLDSFAHSFNRVYAMGPDQLQLGFLKVLKGSPLREKAEEYGIVCAEEPPYEVLFTNWLSYKDIRRLKGVEEMLELYGNSGQYGHTLAVLEKAFTSPFALYESLVRYAEEKGWEKNTPSRAGRCRSLLDFAAEYDGEREELYRELLTFDLYLREKVKSRPDFARELSPFRGRMREFYRAEEGKRRYLPGYKGYDAAQLGRMTHLEPFFYPVWKKDAGEAGVKLGKPVFVLFDYRRRGAVNREARIQVLDQGILSEFCGRNERQDPR